MGERNKLPEIIKVKKIITGKNLKNQENSFRRLIIKDPRLLDFPTLATKYCPTDTPINAVGAIEILKAKANCPAAFSPKFISTNISVDIE